MTKGWKMESARHSLARKGIKTGVIETRLIPQNHLTSECWMVQFKGLDACKTCEFKDTPECGGKEIRKKLMNVKGYKVPLGRDIK